MLIAVASDSPRIDRKPSGGGPRRPTGERSRQRYERRRADVLKAAARVFAERGYHGTTIDDLVEATGLQRGGLYHYIDGKLQLLIAIHERFIEPLLASAREVEALEQPASEKLRALGRALMGDIAAYRDEVTVFLQEWQVVASEPAWQEIRDGRQEFERIVAGVLEQGREEGTFEFDNPRLTLLGFLGMINYTYQWFDPEGAISATEVADSFSEIFLGGILVSNREQRRDAQAQIAT